MANLGQRIWIWKVNQEVDAESVIAKGYIAAGEKHKDIGDFFQYNNRDELLDAIYAQYGSRQYSRAAQSYINMIEGELLERMNRLNQVIGETEGLGTSYHVGGAMFLKVQNGEMTVESLWNLNLKSLMKEYLRGLPDADDTLTKMENAYFLKGTEDMRVEATSDNEE